MYLKKAKTKLNSICTTKYRYITRDKRHIEDARAKVDGKRHFGSDIRGHTYINCFKIKITLCTMQTTLYHNYVVALSLNILYKIIVNCYYYIIYSLVLPQYH